LATLFNDFASLGASHFVLTSDRSRLRALEACGPSGSDEAGADPFTTAELRAIISAAKGLNPTVGDWSGYGRRRAYLAHGLQRHDLDPDRATVIVRRSLTNGRLGPTKTRQARTVSLLHPILDDGIERRPGLRRAHAPSWTR
jgi:hypothetical protein